MKRRPEHTAASRTTPLRIRPNSSPSPPCRLRRPASRTAAHTRRPRIRSSNTPSHGCTPPRRENTCPDPTNTGPCDKRTRRSPGRSTRTTVYTSRPAVCTAYRCPHPCLATNPSSRPTTRPARPGLRLAARRCSRRCQHPLRRRARLPSTRRGRHFLRPRHPDPRLAHRVKHRRGLPIPRTRPCLPSRPRLLPPPTHPWRSIHQNLLSRRRSRRRPYPASRRWSVRRRCIQPGRRSTAERIPRGTGSNVHVACPRAYHAIRLSTEERRRQGRSDVYPRRVSRGG